ncbi:MAG: hypothetical protein ACQETA_09105, partial [Bacteroidota bacterium]
MYKNTEGPERRINRLLIIAGTGRGSGKTTLACQIIRCFSHLGPLAIKISPHFHAPGEGLIDWHRGEKFNIFRESSKTGGKDTSRMLESGASAVYYIQAYDSHVREAFELLAGELDPERPLICESPSLGRYISPGVLFITDSEKVESKKDLGGLLRQADSTFNPLAGKADIGGLDFSGGRWFFR